LVFCTHTLAHLLIDDSVIEAVPPGRAGRKQVMASRKVKKLFAVRQLNRLAL
jgi:hypothetical protein